MKKFFIWFTVIMVLLLSTFKYHLGQIPIVNMYTHEYFFKYFDGKYQGVKYTSSPLLARTLIFFGAEVNGKTQSCQEIEASPFAFHIEAYNRCDEFSKNLPRYHEYDEDRKEARLCKHNHLKIMKILLEHDTNTKGLLHLANRQEISKSLLEHGVNIEEKYRDVTPLFWHTKYTFTPNSYHSSSNIKNSSIAELLLSNSADIYTTNNEEKTLLHVSTAEKLTKILINKGLDIEAKDKFGNTPIFYRAKRTNEIRPLKLLVENGANVNVKNSKGETPLEFGLKTSSHYANDFHQNAEYLVKQGATINDEIYVNALFIKKAKNLDLLLKNNKTVELLEAYKKINFQDEYTLHETVAKMDDKLFPKAGRDKWIDMSYVINMNFIKNLIASYPKKISTIKNRAGNTPLHYVVRHSLELTRYFIKEDVDINAKNNNEQTALFFADSLPIAQLLLLKGADVSIQDKYNKSAIDYIKNPKVLEFLIAQGVDVKQKDKQKNSPFINYINHHQPSFRSIFHENEQSKKYYKNVKIFLENGADVHSKISYNEETALFFVDNIKLLNLLVKHKIDLEQKDKGGRTALFKYMQFPHTSIGEALLEKGANIKAVDNKGRTLLHVVRDSKLAKILTTNGLNVNVQDKEGNQPIHTFMHTDIHRSQDEKYKTLEFFFNNGVEVDSTNKKGQTALMMAFERGNMGFVKLLLDKGADIEKSDVDDNNMLYYAVKNRNFDLIKLLIDEGVEINHKNKIGRSAVDYAYGAEIKNFLIEKGAKFSDRDVRCAN